MPGEPRGYIVKVRPEKFRQVLLIYPNPSFYLLMVLLIKLKREEWNEASISSYDFLSKFEVVKREFVEFVRRIDQKLINVSIKGALPKGYYLEGAIEKVEDKAGSFLPTFDETEDVSKLDPEAFTALCVFIFFASRGF